MSLPIRMNTRTYFHKLSTLFLHTSIGPYLLLTLAFYVSLEVFNFCFDSSLPNHYIMNRVHRLVDAMMFALPALFLRRKLFLFIYISIITVYLLSNVWYFRNYDNPMPFSSYLQFSNLNGLGTSIFHSMRFIDLGIISPLIIFAIMYTTIFPRKWRRMSLLGLICAVSIICIIDIYPHILKKGEWTSPDNIVKFDIPRAIRQYGISVYWYYQLISLKGCTQEDLDFAEMKMKKILSEPASKPIVGPHTKNLIVILVESLASWPIEMSLGGNVEITPNMNKFINDSTSLYFSKVWPDRRDGRSADAQLMLNTGLLPINTGATATLYGLNEYPSLAKALKIKGYSSMSFITGDKNFWNQGTTTRSYGFDRLYDHMEGNAPGYRADEILFDNVYKILSQSSEPFYAQVVTNSTHDAVPTDVKTPLDVINFSDEKIGYHLKLTYYVDFEIGRFLGKLRESGIYDNSIIIIVSDHDAITKNLYEGRAQCEANDRFIPLLILNSPLLTDTDKVVAQIDIYPSLLDIMGVEDYYFRGLGTSIFREQLDYDKTHLGEAGNGGINPDIQQYRTEMWRLSDILIRSDYFGK